MKAADFDNRLATGAEVWPREPMPSPQLVRQLVGIGKRSSGWRSLWTVVSVCLLLSIWLFLHGLGQRTAVPMVQQCLASLPVSVQRYIEPAPRQDADQEEQENRPLLQIASLR